MDNCLRIEKRHLLLLEVLIAFTLIVLTIIPLIYPHTAILIIQEKMIHKMELDHHVNKIHAEMVEKLYKNEINWSDIMNDREVKIIDIPENLPFEGTYQFSEKIRKPKLKDGEEAPKTLYLMNLDYKFISRLDKKEMMTFHYDLFIEKDLAVEKNVQK